MEQKKNKKNKKKNNLDQSNKYDVNLITNDHVEVTVENDDKINESKDSIKAGEISVVPIKEDTIHVEDLNNNAINNDNSKNSLIPESEPRCEFWKNLSYANKVMCVCNSICCSFLFIYLVYSLFIKQ
jgi:hypothetical protein